ncbi:nucleotide disphospho-sugar-binding domain-containing protein [Streptomyces anulatus]|uniref:nucleotide disphospho-sugar-binding domain-containing protein n=1 Tax=Streptomyces TaxID=1883 RepID=UPI00093906D4|nr:nucleotide disphospho-sugar-binding domain-containing protein [Streptomyces sp. CB02115]OKJ53011.1 glycosyl transferase [Streptomyces sp. CB02115]
MRVLVMTTPDPSHLPPLAPVAWALRAAGHEVLVAGQPDSAESARTTGLSMVAFGEPFDTEQLVLNSLSPGKRPLESRPGSAPGTAPPVKGGFGGVWIERARAMAEEYLAFARDYRPDLVLSDPLDYSGLVIGGALGIPVVHHRWGVDPVGTPRIPAAREELADFCRTLGLETLPDPAVVLDPCPAALQLPGIRQGTPVRYVPFNGSGAMPDWVRAEWGAPRTTTRRVVVSLGRRTLAYHGVPFVRALLHALAGVPDVELIATVGAEHRAAVGPVPARVRMLDPFPLHAVLGSCDAIVTHGGSATTMTATLHGVPQLALPQMADCFAHGERLAACGAGVSLATVAEQDDPAVLRASLSLLLDDPSYAAGASRLRADMERMPSPAEVVPALERLAGKASPASF